MPIVVYLRFMLRRLAISFVLLLAFALLQAHNFIPHHHHEIPKATADHHHGEDGSAHHHHDDEQTDNTTDHDVPFTDLTHNADFGKVVSKPQVVQEIVQKPVLELNKILWLHDKLVVLDGPPKHQPPDNDSSLHTIFLSHSLPLRAPPISSLLS
jgi:hypothetical protein